MSRIQEILSKAERDGTVRRTRSLHDEYATAPAVDDIQAREFAEPPHPTPADRPRLPAITRDAPHTAKVPRRDAGNAAAPASIGSPNPESRARRPEPPVAAEPPRPAPLDSGREPVDPTPRAIAELDSHLVAALAPTSIAAEQYRSLRTRLKRAENGRALRTIAVTSPNKGDGKSLTAANLALTMAQEFQQRILLVDCDLRRPSVHRLFGLGDRIGLTEVLMNVASIDQSLVWLPEHHLTVLPAGAPPTHPAELIGSATMRRVLDTLRTRFDRILIDLPPVAPLADVQILSTMVDGLLMIVRAGITPKPAIERALTGLDASKMIGLVLNEAGGDATDNYGYEGYGYIAG
jgi:protein-tyrosine kinase